MHHDRDRPIPRSHPMAIYRHINTREPNLTPREGVEQPRHALPLMNGQFRTPRPAAPVLLGRVERSSFPPGPRPLPHGLARPGATRNAICGDTAALPDSDGRPDERRTRSAISSATSLVRRVPLVNRMSSRSTSTSGPMGVLSVMTGVCAQAWDHFLENAWAAPGLVGVAAVSADCVAAVGGQE